MNNCNSIKTCVFIGTIIFLILLIITQMSIGYNILKPGRVTIAENYDYYHISEIPDFIQHSISKEFNTFNNIESKKSKSEETIQQSDSSPMDSPWPMYCHDVRHTGQSQYSTADNPGIEKWWFDTNDDCVGSPVIDKDGTIYIGAGDFFAVKPDGTQKWKYEIPGIIDSAPAIDENGIIYVGSIWGSPNYMYAFYPDGRLKWKYKTGNDVYSSVTIANDGTIYFGKNENGSPPYSGYIMALYPNGTLKWKYKTNHFVYSSPAISDDGTVYCGCHDTYLYALYPNNGTLKWKYKTGDWIRTSPSIANDGTIYVVSLDNYLHAVYSDGTLKWKTNVDAGTSPTIGQDGTIYAGYKKLYAINPIDGAIKWVFDPGPDRRIRGGTPCHSFDDIIIFGTYIGETDGGELIAVNPDGTERWRIMIATCWVDSAPAIGEDGIIYVGSWHYLHAIGELDPNAPTPPEINGPKKVLPDIEYKFKFKSTSPLDRHVYYWIEWGDNKKTGWIGGYPSGEEITISHEWSMLKPYTIRARCKDYSNLWSDWSYYELNNPRTRVSYDPLFLHFFNQYTFLDYPLNH